MPNAAGPVQLPRINPARLRSYLLRLPLFTRVTIVIIVAAWIAELQSIFNVIEWGSLKPSEIGIFTMHRLNTFPFIHQGFFHMILNILALTPLLERFEAEHGTLMSLALFLGPLSTLPAGLYLLIEAGIWRGNTAIVGASIWVFLLLMIETMKQYRAHPTFSIGPYQIPSWTTPLITAVLIAVLVPGTSLLGHLCGIAVGYLFSQGYLKVLAPPEKILRFVESKLNLLGRLPRYVSVDQKTYGRYGVLPSSNAPGSEGIPVSSFLGTGREGVRLGSVNAGTGVAAS